MARAFLIVLDSVGCGHAADAADFGDAGANTLGHIAREAAAGRADHGRKGPLKMPHLDALGLGAAIGLKGGHPPGFVARPAGLWGVAEEISRGKDTPSGHWELAGVPVPWDWHYFPDSKPAFPDHVVAEVCRIAGTDGIHGNAHASGIPVIEEFGPAHMQDGWPICYTSADSVFQIAAHEEVFGLERLLDLCRGVAPMLHDMKVGRVIARPFVGDAKAGFQRTGNRRDFAIAPPAPTLCDWVQDAGGKVHGVGKIGDIFSMQGISTLRKGGGDAGLFDHLVDLGREAEEGDLVFANFVEFDTLYGHQRDVAGYARALEWFDSRVPEFLATLGAGDLAIFTADHGNDPTWRGTDHTRENVPVVAWGAGEKPVGPVMFSDVAASIADHLNIASTPPGKSFL